MNAVNQRILALKNSTSLREFCRQVGLSYEAAKKYFQRDASPDTAALLKIARHFHTDPQWLMTGRGTASRLNRRAAEVLKAFQAAKGWSDEQMSEQLALMPQVWNLYQTGHCEIPADRFLEFCARLNLPFTFLLGDADPLPVRIPELRVFQSASTRDQPPFGTEDYVSIPLTESAIAAGQPIIPQDKIEDYVLLHIRAARRRNNLVASRVDGDSMEPMLHSGDIVIIDRDDKTLVRNKIFAIYHEQGLTAKYLERKQHLLILRPINPTADVQIIDLNENPSPIVGRIIGAWKDL